MAHTGNNTCPRIGRRPNLGTVNAADETQIGGSSPRPARLGLRPLGVVGVGALLAILALQLALTASHNSITWDEDDHIYAGYMSWKHADFGLNPEHPPLVKQLAALPLLNLPLKMPVLQNRFFKLEAFLGGKDFLFENDADTVLLRARMAAALFAILLALLVFLAAREMFGTGPGLIALTLMVFDPNLLGHGAVVGTDVGLSCFMFAAVYAFYRYVKIPTAARLVVVGLSTGFALASKHTGILVFPMLFLLALTDLLRKTRPGPDSVTGNRHRGESHLSSPATPPDMRVRIRRFGGLS
jgi:dolichyl-phosphate-mannose--protein O-mannosyl transferase